jgi:UDP-N-acetylmuramoylalanine--D-glutamate ligase
MMSFDVTQADVVVVGAGRSGIAAAELLASKGASVTLVDHVAIPAADQARLQQMGIRVEHGTHESRQFDRADLIVLSPGVPPRQPVFETARERGVTIIGEIELASRWLTGRVIAITGTKGKSTTTTLAARMLAHAGFSVTAGGNLGTPLSEQVASSTRAALHVVEVSSFQLETIDTFRPWIAVLLNLSPDHLDRHASFDEYARAKSRIFENQRTEDWAVVNADDPAALAIARNGRARRFDFAVTASPAEGVTVQDGQVARRAGHTYESLFPVSAVELRGRHLLADVVAASAVSVLAGAPPAAMRAALQGFTGLEHALERVLDIGGVTFVNDSKATNVLSARQSIESFDRGVVAILGGRYKGGDFADLRVSLAQRGDGVVAIGEAATQVTDALSGIVPIERATTMAEAVRRAYALARPGGTVVLAPACSSFDMFADYAARGRSFKDEVHRLAADVQGDLPVS